MRMDATRTRYCEEKSMGKKEGPLVREHRANPLSRVCVFYFDVTGAV